MFTEEYDSGFQRLERFLAASFEENKSDHQKSLDAIQNQNYGEALRILTDLADNKNDRVAQYNLSMLYSTGSEIKGTLPFFERDFCNLLKLLPNELLQWTACRRVASCFFLKNKGDASLF